MMKPIKKCNMQVGKFYLQKHRNYAYGWIDAKVMKVTNNMDRHILCLNAPNYDVERTMPIRPSRGYRYYELSNSEIPIYILKVSE